MALKKTPKTVEDSTVADVLLARSHPSNPIAVTPADAIDEPFPHILIRAPRLIVLRGSASNRLDLGAVLTMPEMVTAQVQSVQPDAHAKGYTVTSGLLKSGDEVCVFLRNHTMRTVEFPEGSVVGILTFQRHRALTMEIDTEMAAVKEKVSLHRPVADNAA